MCRPTEDEQCNGHSASPNQDNRMNTIFITITMTIKTTE